MSVSSGNVRKFILDSFSDEELEGLCFVYFQEVENAFSSGMSKEGKARQLIEYCQRRGRVPDLFKALEAERSVMFAQCFTGPLPTQLDDEFPEIEPIFLSAREIQVSEVIADRLITERAESIRVFLIYLVALLVLGILVMAGALLFLLDPFRQITIAGGIFMCSLSAWQVRGIIGWEVQKGRFETIKTILSTLKQDQGGIDTNTWKQIQAYLWGEMNKAAPSGKVMQ